MTAAEIKEEILTRLGSHLGSFPVDDMVEDYIEAHGLVSVEDVPEDEFFALVEAHDTIWN